MKLILEKSKDGRFWGTVQNDATIITEQGADEEEVIKKVKQQVGLEFNLRLKNITFDIKKKYK